MRKWFVESYNIGELQPNLNALAEQGYEIFKIIRETFSYLVIAYKESK